MKNTKIREDIKVLANEQLVLKPQRKTINFSGTRTVEAGQAVQKADENKQKLRHLYVAYNVLRGKESQPFTKREFIQSLVDKYVEEYKEDFYSKKQKNKDTGILIELKAEIRNVSYPTNIKKKGETDY